MRFRIGLPVQWPDGTPGTVLTEDFRHEGAESARDAYRVYLLVKREEEGDIRGTLRFTHEAYLRLPGNDEVPKANAVAMKLVEWISELGLMDGFFLHVDVDDDGVHFYEK